MIRARTRARTLLLASCAALAACGDDSTTGGPARDTTADVAADADASDATTADAADATAGGDADDTGPADAGLQDAADAAPDTSDDADAPDTTDPDVTPPDATTDPDTTTEPDAGAAFTCDDHSPWRRGPLRVSRTSITLPRSTAGTFAAEVFAPAGATDPLPLVIFNHGFQLTAAEFTTYGEWLASHGFVAVLPTIGDNLFSARTHAQLGADAIVWLDHLLTTSEGYDGGYLADAVGIAGHSRGGKQSLLAAANDARFAAVFGIDPVDSGPPIGNNPTDYPSVAPERMGDLARPVGLVGAGRAGESVGFGPACAPPDENYAQYFAAAPGPAWAWTLPDAGHLDFLDACSNPIVCATCTAGDDPTAARDFARATMVAFFRTHLLDDATCAAWLDGDALVEDATLTVSVESR